MINVLVTSTLGLLLVDMVLLATQNTVQSTIYHPHILLQLLINSFTCESFTLVYYYNQINKIKQLSLMESKVQVNVLNTLQNCLTCSC